MNFGKSAPASRQSGNAPSAEGGNAMIYILLALGLLALLTSSLMSQDSSGGDDISADQAEFQATQIIAYAGAAQNVIDQMVGTGTEPGAIDFALPNATSFNTAPYKNKFFHPQGGGLNYKPADPKIFTGATGTPVPGWYINRFNNVEWTPTTGQDIIVTAFKISKPVCETINKKITGSKTIPVYGAAIGNAFVGTSGGAALNENVTAANCATCVGYSNLCVSNSVADTWAYYSVILGR